MASVVEFEKLFLRQHPDTVIHRVGRQRFSFMIKRNDQVDLVCDKVNAFEMFVIGEPDNGNGRGILRRCR
ncbi:hypothetical protein SCL_1020 [Sulfuricaulis limicola]|uniref:Uncharacterized protein n=1 Tax=Sulfuricaulis limicola TaxID=1620215 RepID=A0A1B4XEV1_9GAMM|nr:hypothetical protein SCL_1020 [Sulfuricaulis limicola]